MIVVLLVPLLRQHGLPAIPRVDPAQDQIPIRLPVLATHNYVDDGVDAGGQVDQQVT